MAWSFARCPFYRRRNEWPSGSGKSVEEVGDGGGYHGAVEPGVELSLVGALPDAGMRVVGCLDPPGGEDPQHRVGFALRAAFGFAAPEVFAREGAVDRQVAEDMSSSRISCTTRADMS